jgi:hypothetical protein
MNRPIIGTAIVVLSSLATAACAPTHGGAEGGRAVADRDRPAGRASTEWRPLIDQTLSAWRGYRQESIPAGWRVTGGTLGKDAAITDLVSRDEFGDFELAFDWQVGAGGNAGVFYRGTEEFDRIYWTGPEYQLLDDAGHADGKRRVTAAGAAYGLYPARAGVVKPAGEWNSSRIVVRGDHVEHWLNGEKLLEYELGGTDWSARVAGSKFSEWPKYGRASRGRIGIQGDHSGMLAIRDMRVRELR